MLTAKTIGQLALPAGKSDVIVFDDAMPGFGYRMRVGGDQVRKTFVAQYRSKGRTRRVLIGSAEVLSVDQARAAAKKVLAAAALGADPQADRAKARLQRTFASVVDAYLAAKAPQLRPSSLKVTTLYLRGSYFKPLHSIGIADIVKADVAARLTTIVRDNGTPTASAARRALNAMMVWAMEEGWIESNPVTGTRKPHDPAPRDRVLDDGELGAIWRACGDDEFGRIVKLMILTAARRQEIGGMRLSEIDDRGVFTLPASRAKNHRALELPLPGAALEIIKSVPVRVGRDNLFGNRAKKGYTSWDESKQNLDDRLLGKVLPWQLRDLRRTAATRMADLGTQPHVIEAVLNHYSGSKAGVAGVYNRSPYAREMCAALAMWADHVCTLVTGGARKVVAFPQQA